MADMLRGLLERSFRKAELRFHERAARPGSASGGRAREAMGQVLAGAAVEPHAGAEFPRGLAFPVSAIAVAAKLMGETLDKLEADLVAPIDERR